MGQITELYKGEKIFCHAYKCSNLARKMRIRLEATSVAITTEESLRGLALKNLPPRSAILNFFRAYLVAGQLVNPDYATVLVYSSTVPIFI